MYSPSFEKHCGLMRFRTCYPKIGHLDILYILSWRNLRKQQKQEDHSDILLWNRSWHPHVSGACPTPTGKKRTYLWRQRGVWEESELTGFAVSLFTTIASDSLTFCFPPQLRTFHQTKPKHPHLAVFLDLHSWGKRPCYAKLRLNTFGCSPPVNLSWSV